MENPAQRKLQPDQQEQALAACFKEDWSAGGQKPKRLLLPVRSLQFWIESNILLILKLAPFDKRDAQLVATAGSCTDCHMRTGHNKLLFSDLGKLDACTAPSCYQAKVDAHLARTIATKPKLVQISTAYGQQKEGSATLSRNKYTEIRPEKPATKEEAARPEFKTCKYTTEAIVSEGIDKGELRKVCTETNCPVHHPKRRPQRIADDAKFYNVRFNTPSSPDPLCHTSISEGRSRRRTYSSHFKHFLDRLFAEWKIIE